MSSVDTRIVKMKFDNSEFEKNVKTSKDSLDKFKETLNFDGMEKSFNKVTNAAKTVDLSSIGASLDELNSKFSTSGVSWMTVVSNFTNTALNAAKKVSGSVLSMIKNGGMKRAQNIENAKFQLKGLGVSWEEAQKDINSAVEDTAYGLDEAAVAASQLKATGLEFNKDMGPALKAISGVAAQTNSTYSDISSIFTKIAGQGKITSQELNQFASRGLNVAATLGEQLGYSEQEIREFVSKGKISFEMFSDSMYMAFADHAKDANSTFQGALANTKAALGRIGEGFITPFMAAEGAGEGLKYNLVDVLNSLKKAINEIKVGLGPLYKMVQKGVNFVSERLVSILDNLSNAKKGMSPIASFIQNTFYILKSIWYVLSPIAEIAFNLIKSLLSPLGMFAKDTGKISKSIGPLLLSIGKLLQRFSDLLKKMGIFKIIGGALCLVFKGIGAVIYGLIWVLAKVADGIMFVSDKIKEFAKIVISKAKSIGKVIANAFSGFKDGFADGWIKLFNKISKAFSSFVKKLKPIGEKISNVFGDIKAKIALNAKDIGAKALLNIPKSLNKASTSVKSGIKQVQNKYGNIFKGFSAYMSLSMRTLLSGNFAYSAIIFKDAFVNVWENVGDGIKEVGHKVKTAFYVFIEDTKQAFNGTSFLEGGGGLSGVLEVIFDEISNFVRLITKLTETLTGINTAKATEKAVEGIQSARDRIVDYVYDLQQAHPSLKSALKKINDTLSSGLNTLSELLKNIGKNISTHVAKIRESLGGLSIKDKFSALKDYVKELHIWEKVTDFLSKVFIKMKEIWTAIKPYLKEIWEKVKELVNNIVNKVKELWNKWKPYIDIIKNSLLQVWDQLKEAFGNIKGKFHIDSLLDIVKGIIATGILAWLLKATKGFANFTKTVVSGTDNLFKSLGNIGKSLTGAIDTISASIGDFFTGLGKQANSKAILNIAYAIGILALAVVALSSVDSDALFAAVMALSILMLMFSEVIESFGKLGERLSKGDKQLDKSKGIIVNITTTLEGLKLPLILLALGVAIRMIAKSIAELAMLEPTQLIAPLAALAITIGLFVAALLVLTKFAKDESFANLGKLSALLTGLAVVVGAIGLAMALISKNNWESILAAGLAMGLVVGVFGGVLITLIKTLAKMNPKDLTKKTKAMADIMKSFSKIILALTVSLAVLSLCDPGRLIVASLAISLAIGAIAGALYLIDKLKVKDTEKISKSLVSLSKGILVLALALKIVSTIDFLSLIASAGTLVAILAAVVASIIILDKFAPNIDKISKSIMLFGAGMALVGAGALLFSLAILKLIENIDAVKEASGKLAETMPNLARSLGLALVSFIHVLAENAPQLISDLTTLLVGIIMGGIQGTLESIDKFIEPALEIIIHILDAIQANSQVIFDKLFAIIISFLVSLAKATPKIVEAIWGIVKGIIEAIKKIAKEEDIDLTELIVILLSLAAVFVALIIASKFAKEALLGAVAVFAVAIVLVGIFWIMTQLDTAKVLVSALAIAGFAVTMTVVLGMLALLSPFIALAMISLLGLVAVITVLTGVIVALGALAQIPGFEFLLNEGAQVLGKIGEAIGNFVGSLIAGIGKAIAGALPYIGLCLSMFMINAQPFIQGARKIDKRVSDGIGSLASAIIKLTGAELVQGLANFLTGGKGLITFGEKLNEFAPYLIDFADQMHELPLEDMQKATLATEAISNLAKGLPSSGGVMSWFTGDNDLSAFGEQLAPFAENIADFAENCRSFKLDWVKRGTYSGTLIANMAKKMPNQGGILAWFTGDNTLDMLGSQMSDFATHIWKFADTCKGLDSKAVEVGCEAGTKIAEMAKNLPNEGGVAGFFAGENSMSLVGSELEAFSGGLVSWSENSEKIKMNYINHGINASNKIIDFLSDLDKNAFTSGSTFQTLVNKVFCDGGLDKVGSSIATFSSNLSEINADDMNTGLKGMGDLVEILKSLDGYNGTGVSEFTSSINSINDSNMDEFLKNFKNLGTSAGENYGKGLKEGIQNKRKEVKQKANSTRKDITSTFTKTGSHESIYTYMYNTGKFVCEGLATGMSDFAYLVSNQSNILAQNKTIKNINQVLGINSPSKEAYKIGRFFDMGLANGLKNSSNLIQNETEKVGNNMLSIGSIMDSIYDILNYDIEPTISPVLDTSGVYNGLNAIDSQLYSSMAYARMKTGGIKMDNSNTINVQTDNADIVDEIKNLRDDFTSLKGEIGNMKVYMNGKTLVGTIAPDMDRELARRTISSARGN